MKTRKRSGVQDVTKKIVEMVRDGMKGLPPEEQERRLKSFCDAFSARPRTRAKASGSSQRAQGRTSARGRA
jgi:hypothetical protein